MCEPAVRLSLVLGPSFSVLGLPSSVAEPLVAPSYNHTSEEQEFSGLAGGACFLAMIAMITLAAAPIATGAVLVTTIAVLFASLP